MHTRKVFALLAFTVLLPFVFCHAQSALSPKAWSLLEKGLSEKKGSQRLIATRVLGLIPDDPRTTQLAGKALADPDAAVRAAAATALGQMNATSATADLKRALNDKDFHVVMAAAHALQSLHDPACYAVYYAFLTGERKDNSGIVSQEMEVLHDPKVVAAMGFSEGIGFVPFASAGWDAIETIMKDRKSGTAARAALISALATDPDPRVNDALVKQSQSQSWVLRMAAVEAIAKRGNAALAGRIEGLLNDPKDEVRYAAAAAIIHLNNRKGGTTAKATT